MPSSKTVCEGIRQNLYKLLAREVGRNSDIVWLVGGVDIQELTCIRWLSRSVDTCKQTDHVQHLSAQGENTRIL